jgi:hypothetical protein
MRDGINGKTIISAVDNGAKTATTTGTVIDVRGYDEANFVVQVGTVTTADATNKFTIDLYEGDLASGTDGTSVAAGDRIGAAVDIDGTGDAQKTIAFGYLGKKRYVHVKATEAGTASVIFGATAILGQGAQQPSAGPDLN